jgi:hypothetical protein
MTVRFEIPWPTGRIAELHRRARSVTLVALTALSCVLMPTMACAVPSYAIQTDQPCSACHIGAFGPRLNQTGRDFKLYGYTANDTKEHTLPFSLMADASFVHTAANQPSNASVGYAQNNNVTFETIDVFYAGNIFAGIGAFIEADYDAIAKSAYWEDFDVRRAFETEILGSDTVLGLSLNNSPTEADLWDSSPQWVFPYASSGLSPIPASSTLIEKLPSTVMGLGGYAMWDDMVYVEGDAYGGLDDGVLRALGTDRINGSDELSGPALYWRIALQHEFGTGEHYIELGAYGLNANLYPQGIQSAGSDAYADFALDATYQWRAHPELSTSDSLSAHLLYIHEDSRLNAGVAILGSRPSDSLSTFRADLTYAFGATYSPTVQYFHTTGTTDAAYWTTPNGSPDSEGWVAEMDYIPWGKPDSPWEWLNARIALQYTAYTKFDGSSLHASDNDTLLLNVKLALATNR